MLVYLPLGELHAESVKIVNDNKIRMPSENVGFFPFAVVILRFPEDIITKSIISDFSDLYPLLRMSAEVH